MAQADKDHWSSVAYQKSASFVPKLATKVMQWLDPKPDDVILDVGCGDGVLDMQIAVVLSQGKGSLLGLDASPAMIGSAREKADRAGASSCTFEVIDATEIINIPKLQESNFTKVFSNAALHWILRPESKRKSVFEGIRNALAPGGTFVFEMGGLGNVVELRAGIMMAVARRIGLQKAVEIDPWFFPDEDWVREMMEKTVGGWKVERIEREYRSTKADEGGVRGWVTLMGSRFFEAVPEAERDSCIKEAVEVLEVICRQPSDGSNFGYVRLRVQARKMLSY